MQHVRTRILFGAREAMKVEVRCCCDPSRLIGHVQIQAERVRRGPIVFPLVSPIAVVGLRWKGKAVPFRNVALEIEKIGRGRASWLAVKSEGTPIETLRLIPTFEEAK